MTPAEFWTTKSPLPEYHTVTFDHPDFDGPIRLVANQFAPVTLGGYEHAPAPMTVKPPDQTGNAQAKLSLAFPRQVVGREFKRQLRLTIGSRAPVTVVYAIFCNSLTTPARTWRLYLSDDGGVTFTGDSVQVVAKDDNPMRRGVADIYDPSVYTGLELI